MMKNNTIYRLGMLVALLFSATSYADNSCNELWIFNKTPDYKVVAHAKYGGSVIHADNIHKPNQSVGLIR